MQSSKSKYAFLILEALIYLSFLTLDILALHHNISLILRYSGVILCFLFFIGKKDILLTAAQFFVLAADLFLLFMNTNESLITGTLLFAVVQIFYFLYGGRKKLYLLLIPVVPAVIALCIGDGKKLIIPTVILYGLLLMTNVIRSFFSGNRGYCVGLILLLLCDINVAICNIPSVTGAELPIPLLNAASVLMWFFYLPSQVILNLTATHSKTKAVPME